jgi:hypothetical protein
VIVTIQLAIAGCGNGNSVNQIGAAAAATDGTHADGLDQVDESACVGISPPQGMNSMVAPEVTG